MKTGEDHLSFAVRSMEGKCYAYKLSANKQSQVTQPPCSYRINNTLEENMHPYILCGCSFPPRYKTALKEDILGAYPPRRCGLSDLCHILCVRNLALKTVGYAPIISHTSHPMKLIRDDIMIVRTCFNDLYITLRKVDVGRIPQVLQ